MFESCAERVRPLAPEGAYAVLARAKALEAQSRDIIHLEIGQPDFPTPAHVAEAGVHFGPGGEGYLRISYATSTELIEAAVERMRPALAAL